MQRLGLRGMPGWAGPQYPPMSVRAGVSLIRLGYSIHQNVKELDLWEDFVGICRLSSWDCSTQWFMQRAGDGDRQSQDEPWNSPHRNLPDPSKSGGWEETRWGQAAAHSDAFKGRD